MIQSAAVTIYVRTAYAPNLSAVSTVNAESEESARMEDADRMADSSAIRMTIVVVCIATGMSARLRAMGMETARGAVDALKITAY